MSSTTSTRPAATITTALDRFESHLPLVPRRILRLQRAIAGRGFGIVTASLRAITGSSDRVERSVRSGVNTVRGQARAQTEATADTAAAEASNLLGRAERAVDGVSTSRLEDWTKAELYERAQELDIDGRSTMSKQQLVSALRSV